MSKTIPIAFALLFCGSFLNGCVSDYRNSELEYRLKIVEKRMTLLEMNAELLDSCQ